MKTDELIKDLRSGTDINQYGLIKWEPPTRKEREAADELTRLAKQDAELREKINDIQSQLFQYDTGALFEQE